MPRDAKVTAHPGLGKGKQKSAGRRPARFPVRPNDDRPRCGRDDARAGARPGIVVLGVNQRVTYPTTSIATSTVPAPAWSEYRLISPSTGRSTTTRLATSRPVM